MNGVFRCDRIFPQILTERPSDASAVFEHLSASVKEARVTPSEDKTHPLGSQAAMADQLKWAQTSQALFAVPDEPAEGGPIVPDILNEANLWEWGGLSFGRLETYRMYLSIKKVRRFILYRWETNDIHPEGPTVVLDRHVLVYRVCYYSASKREK